MVPKILIKENSGQCFSYENNYLFYLIAVD